MSLNAIAYVDIRVFSHATEDENKVIEAVKKILPTDHLEDVAFEKHTLRGHYGNPITFFETRIKNKEILKAIVENLSLHLNTLDKEELRSRIGEFTENGSLYIRLDKQAASEGEFKLAQVDPIRVRVRFKRKDVEKICQELGIIS